jgi:molybdopterin-binding protein
MKLHTVRAAADRLGVGYSTLKRWIRDGYVRTTQTAGGHHRVSDAEIDRLTTRRTPTDRPKPRALPGHGAIVMISGRNRLRGFVDEIRTDGLMAQVRLRVGDQSLTAVITRDAVQELNLRRGDDALAVIKSTEVMIAKDTQSSPAPRQRITARRRR